jgi:hypothetical protein
LLTPLLRFHLRVGVRLAMRTAAPAIGLPVVALLLQQEPAGAAVVFLAWLFAAPGNAASGLAVGVVALALAGWAAPRVTSGMAGWMRHLPVADASQRRAALAALVAAQAPLVIAMLLGAIPAAQRSDNIPAGRIVSLLIMTAAAALAAWPGAHAWRSRPFALLAILVAASATRSGILAAVVLVAGAERLASPLAPPRRAVRRGLPAVIPVPILVGIRALDGSLIGALALSLLPLAAMAALRINNDDLTPAVAAGAARLGGGLAVALVIGKLVERLSVRRPAWGWARSLPAGAVRRIDEDAVLLAVPCLVPLAVTARMDPVAALVVAACVPFAALRGVAGLRRSIETRMGPSARVLAETALLACWVALIPWLALAALAASPLARRAAAEEDRSQRVSQWEERHHETAGDPLSWSAR